MKLNNTHNNINLNFYQMKRNFLIGFFAMAAMLLVTSCSKDYLVEKESNEMAVVSFNITTEGAQATRAAISDGSGINKLYWTVFYGDTFVKKGEATVTNKQATVEMPLVKGQTYKVAFFAQNSACTAYSLDNNYSVVTINYSGANNDDTRDAFFGNVTFTVGNNANANTQNVTLRRPFAQINVGIEQTDWDAAVALGHTITKSVASIKNVATGLNLLDGTVSNKVDITYSEAAIPTQDLSVSSSTFKYLSMCYVLPYMVGAGDQEINVEAEFTFKADGKEDIVLKDGLSSVPVTRNKRTNIVGSFFTTNVTFNITVDPDFGGNQLVDLR